MKRSVITEMEQLKAKLSGYVALYNYRQMNLCIEAEPAALLSVRIITEEGEKNMEDVAQVAVDKKYHFIFSPLYDDELRAIAKGIFEAHPEFKQEIKIWDGYDETDPSGKYIYCTMPEVNKDRRDALNTAVDTLYNKCKADMENANAKCTAKIASLMFDNSPEEIDKVKQARENVVKKFEDIREDMHTKKLEEIEEAYQRYLKEQEQKDAEKQEAEEALGKDKILSMKMSEKD